MKIKKTGGQKKEGKSETQRERKKAFSYILGGRPPEKKMILSDVEDRTDQNRTGRRRTEE